MSPNMDRAAKVTRSPVFRVFGLGLDPLEMADRVDRLREDQPDRCALLFDVANRVLFVDYLRFEVGWELEAPEGDSSEYLRLDYNLDAIETYLLCTCIDALGGRIDTTLRFPDWLAEHGAQIDDALSQGAIASSKRYGEVTRRLFTLYEHSAPGLSRSFLETFTQLPGSVKEYLADGIVVIEGGLESDQFISRMQRWWERSVDSRVQWIARRYLWERRRGSYTHRARIEGALHQGIFRRMTERGTLAEDEAWWNSTSFASGREPDRASLTVFMKRSIDEGFVLRGIVTIRALKSLLGYDPDDGYLHDLSRYYEMVAASYAFLHELERNREYLNLLNVPEELAHDRHLGSYALPLLATRAGERFLGEFIHSFRVIERFLESYLEQLRKLNEDLSQFNASAEAKLAGRYRWERAIRQLVEQPGLRQSVSSIRWYDQMIESSIRGAVQRGEMISVFECKAPSWPAVWNELRRNVAALPPCPSHPQHPHVTTLRYGVINDVLQMSREGITLRSHRTSAERFVSAGVFEAWWRRLQECGRVSLGSPPRTDNSRVVGAILAAALPDRVRVVDGWLVLSAS
jgi:hypothetical protein